MRKITAGMFITADGVVEGPENWNPPYYDDEMTQAVMGQLANSGIHLYGRRSYELFRAVFTGPSAARIPHATLMTDTPKIVVSTTVDRTDWGPTTLISKDVAGELTKIKQQDGKERHPGPVPAPGWHPRRTPASRAPGRGRRGQAPIRGWLSPGAA